MSFRKVLGPTLAVLLLVGVGLAIDYSIKEKKFTDTADMKAAGQVTVKVLTSPEKEAFLADPDLTKVLDSAGITLSIQKAGAGEIVTRPDLTTFDAAFTASEHAAAKISQTTGSKRTFTSFHTPMAVASWKTLIPVLEKSGLVTSRNGEYFLINMPKLVTLMQKGTRWKDLPGNSAYAVSKSILITSPDVRNSNSGAMYLALASYVANGNNVVVSEADAGNVAASMVGLFTRQGFQEYSSTGPFEDYVSMGLGKAPLVMVYEQQFLEYVFSHQNANSDMVLLYPAPTVLSKHIIVALTDSGARFAQLMTSNAKVNSIAQRYGFRGQDNTDLFKAAEERNLAIPHTLVDVVDTPRYEILEKLINRIDEGSKQ
jgi:hypothetical protein